ncbi:MAG: aromatic ring-hydroxylating dioxygenase subunit alpha [Alphaproteobacteria bacterium]|jgi:choline monooxygenase|nr:aromatic ring-hydroxylating dioxygenase subunit alpha [Rhodospirillaceae bacterium]MBT6203604.1 aromatic ring-hydroxylating dioxygenase subunit alpha [Rhodospirillaceae bacterium]MBT6512809.1 aromatic ring-hydroxylating dioxygenase subunit alpha [Rhodospirillaceae bacterium]MBT7613781.1 aromatic ring-hydroxylating dioxygenase subunit alpha [Rhodospirillaceae bacterium]MDG2482873.1 aromatic ring-hydroxylating dioxygenase subunit alpha [Alphaproteobacteria bacterium]
MTSHTAEATHASGHDLSEPDLAALNRVLSDTADARGLPNSAFTSDAFYDLEREQLFSRTWFCIGFASDIPDPGDVSPVWFGDLSILLVRGDDHAVCVFHNVCPHRGMRLVREPAKGKRVLACPYHCWTFDKTGKLLRRPYFLGPDDPDGLPREADPPSLRAIRSAMWSDAIMINLDGRAPEFAEHVRHLDAAAAPYGAVREGPNTDNIDYVIDANWKLIVENFIDSYHVKWIHKELDATTPMTTYRHETVGNISIGRAPAPLSRPGYGGNMPGWPGMSEESTQTLTYLALFPNLLLVFSSDQMTCFHLMPDGPFRTRERIKFYMPHDALSPEFETDRTESVNAYRKLNDEDVWLVEELQQSRRSPAFDGGRFSPHWDRITHHFAKQVAEAVLA